jgi:quercetin dioxygenase-like cupin family protein
MATFNVTALAIALLVAGSASTVAAQDGHRILTPQEVKWSPAPLMPPGAETTVLYGDPGKQGLFVLRLKVPRGFRSAAHSHPNAEIVTVLSGTVHLGLGKTADRSKTQALPAGSFFALPAGMEHYGYGEEETVIQLNSPGPWGLVPASVSGSASAQDGHTILTAPQVKWRPAPPSMPPGAQAAVLYGDPGKEGLFALRLELPKGYHIPPHACPRREIVTVLSGTLRLGMGTSADRSTARALPAGSFFTLPAGAEHYVYADEDTVIQLNSSGPWGLDYVNPQDDPRQ